MPIAHISNTTQLYYEDSDPENKGQLPTLVFLHGGNGNCLSWWQQIPVFSAEFRCITYDARGFRWSPDVTGDGVLRCISDLTILVDFLNLDSFALVAQSMGGRAAMTYAVRHPDKIDALVLGNTWGCFAWPEQWELTKELEAKAKNHAASGLIRGLSVDFQRDNKELAFLYKSIGAMNDKKASIPHGPLLEACTLAQVKNMQVPVLCTAGTEDDVFPHPLVPRLAEEAESVSCVTFEGAGHSVYYEQPQKWNEVVLTFLRKWTGRTKGRQVADVEEDKTSSWKRYPSC